MSLDDYLSPARHRAAEWMRRPDDGRARWGEDGDRAFSDGTPLPDPPDWSEMEWCDEGGSCEHPDCMVAAWGPDDRSTAGWP